MDVDGLLQQLVIIFLITSVIHEVLHVILDFIVFGARPRFIFMKEPYFLAVIPSTYSPTPVESFIVNVIPGIIHVLLIKVILDKKTEYRLGKVGMLIMFIIVARFDVLNFVRDVGWLKR